MVHVSEYTQTFKNQAEKLGGQLIPIQVSRNLVLTLEPINLRNFLTFIDIEMQF